jgi:lipid-A-disaccharide synthase
MKYFIVAGEHSGDLHGSNLVRELINHDRQAEINCWGGDLMKAAGANLLKDYKELAFMGFAEVLKNLGMIRRNLALCKNQINEFKPDVVILIDYPGFNFRIAEYAKKCGFRIFYYISPKIWAWKEGRIERVRKYVDRMYIIFPFEVDFYKKHGITVEYRGNPLLDETEKKLSAFPSKDKIRKSLNLGDKPVIALLAGSRKSEVRLILPKMIEAVHHFPGYQFVLAGVKNIPDELYNGIIGKNPVQLIRDKTYEILYVSEAALVKSGTSTLETALLRIPEVVCYKGDFFSMLIAWIVIKVKFISLVNLIAGFEAVKELVQYSLNEMNIVTELKAILPGGSKRTEMLENYDKVRQILGPAGASARIAEDMVKVLRNEGVKA